MSIPANQPQPPYGWRADPGWIPLRPLAVGDLLGGGFAVVRRHITLLGPLAVIIAVVSAAAELAILSATGTLELFASGEWITSWQEALAANQLSSLPTGLYLGVGAGSLISMAGAFLLSGAAASCVAGDAISRGGRRQEISARLARALPRLLGVAVLLAVTVLTGSLLFFVPGLLAYAVWAVAGPVAVMEPSSAPLARSLRLTRGSRWRIIGASALILIITAVIDAVTSSVGVLAARAVGVHLSAVGELILSDAIGAVVAAVTTSWVGAVIALLYLDIRIRTENLAPALRAAAA